MLNFKLVVIVYIILFNFSGVAQEINANRGLLFEKELEYRLEDSSYTDVIKLLDLESKIQALQFRIMINKAPDDSTILIFKDIQKGADLSDPGWLLDYNVVEGPELKNGASKDEIYIVLYSSNLKGGLLPGNHFELIKVNYEVAALPDLQNTIKSSMMISHAEASTTEGLAIDVKPTRDEFKIYGKRK